MMRGLKVDEAALNLDEDERFRRGALRAPPR
jgi:hypothetical protein